MCTFQRTKIQDGYSGGKMSKLKKDVFEYKIEKILDMAKYDKQYLKNRKEYVKSMVSWFDYSCKTCGKILKAKTNIDLGTMFPKYADDIDDSRDIKIIRKAGKGE
jgi:hypothetical protein